MEDEDAIVDGGDAARTEETEAPDDTFDIEVDGQTHTLPAALTGAFLRQADYTRKTQELAEQRRALEAERAAHAQAVEAQAGASQDRLRLAALDHQLGEFQQIDWQALAAADPQNAQTLWAAYQRMAQARGQLAAAVAHHADRAQLAAARQTAEAMADTGRQLAQEIEGWSPEVAGKLVEYAKAFGVTLEELGQMADPRLWKLLHKAWRADQAAGAEAPEAPAVRPAVTVSGGGAGGAGVRDALGTKEWMRRRNEQVARGR